MRDIQRLQRDLHYTVDVVSVFAPRANVTKRAESRAAITGKAYVLEQGRGLVESIAAFLPVMAAANGMCYLVDNTKEPPLVVKEEPCPLHGTDLLDDVQRIASSGSHISHEEMKAAKANMGIGDLKAILSEKHKIKSKKHTLAATAERTSSCALRPTAPESGEPAHDVMDASYDSEVQLNA